MSDVQPKAIAMAHVAEFGQSFAAYKAKVVAMATAGHEADLHTMIGMFA